MKRKYTFPLFIFFFCVFIDPFSALSVQDETKNVDQLYLDVQFPGIVRYFEKKDYQKLSLEEKLLFIESLARTSRGLEAKEKLAPLLLFQHCLT